MTTKRDNPKVAGEILSSGEGDPIAIVGETLAEALDIETWTVVADTIPKKAPADQARDLEDTDAFLKSIEPSRK